MKSKTFQRILRYLKPYTPLLVCTFLLATVCVAGQLAVPYFVGRAIDCIVAYARVDFEKLYELFVVIAVCVAAVVVSQFIMSVVNNRIAYHVLADVRRDAFTKLNVLPLSYLDSRAHGDVISAIVTDAEQFSDGLLLGFTQLFTGIVTILGVIVVMFVMRWEVALVVVLLTPISLFVSRFIASRTYSRFAAQSAARADQTAFIDEMIGQLKTVKAYGREDENELVFKEKNDLLAKRSLSAIFMSSTVNPVTRFVNALVYAAVTLTSAFLVISTGGVFSVGKMTTFLSYSTQYTKPFNEISEVISEFQNALACAERLFAIVTQEAECADGATDLKEVKGNVTLENVAFSYDPEKELIKNFDLQAPSGKRVAIVGPTGCGKTTVINLLMRFYDVNEGSVRVDGHDIRAITRTSLRKNFGMVLQETWLKEGTVRENLCMGYPDCPEEDMIAACKAAHAHAFIERMPKGYDTLIGEGAALSEGQRQLLCIARVMICRPPMLILDEATSRIDTRTERIVQDAFAKLMQGRTCFVVAHRLSTIRTADVIVVMKAGKIIEQGTHDELIEKKGFYSQLYYAQFAGV